MNFCVFAQERLFVDKECGGSEKGFFGKIQDDLNVTPTGQLSYEIPIPTVPGTAGMKPNISISYNSSTKYGLAGYGFDITGLSIISRVPFDKFHTGIVCPTDFISRSFALDGQRLMLYGGSKDVEYRTENNAFAKIIGKGRLEGTPETFRVYTKSGLIYDYVTLAKALGTAKTDSTLYWLVTKVSDTKGNYFTIKYGGDVSCNDFYPTQIDYTGNDAAGLTPYASIRFSYIHNTDSPIAYVNGAKVKKNKLLSSVVVYNGKQPIRIFQLYYKIIDNRHQLREIIERAPGGNYKKNSTKFSWSNVDNFNVTKYDYTKTTLIHKASLNIADFNGDGMADFIATPENDKAGWKGYKLFISNGTSFENVASAPWTVYNENRLEQVTCGDYNGDGFSDVIVKRTNGNWHNCDYYKTTVGSDGKIKLSWAGCFLSQQKDYAIQTIESNGDGADDLFVYFKDSKDYRVICSRRNESGIIPLDSTVAGSLSQKWDRVEFGDFNGDGLTDVMNLNDKGNIILCGNSSGYMNKYLESQWPDKNHYLEFGDFNGDGKTDMLLTGWSKYKNAWTDWCINYSKGNGRFVKEYIKAIFDTRTKHLIIADYNGDGLDDIQAIDKESESMTAPQVYLCQISCNMCNFSKQEKGGLVYGTNKWNFYSGDFNGDGKTDLVCTSNWNKSNWDGYQLYLMPTAQNALLTGIQDGLGNKTIIDYKYLTDKSVFKKGNTVQYPIVSTGSSWPVVASVSTPDGIGGTNTVSYKYENALFHKAGLGLLGFEKCYVKDETNNSLSTTEYSVDTENYIIAPKYSNTTINNKVVEECYYSYNYTTSQAYPPSQNQLFCSVGYYSYLPKDTHQKSYEYNSGELIKDVKTSYEYDEFGNPTKTIVKDGNLETTTENSYTNDVGNWFLGRLTESTVTKSCENNTVTRKSSFKYDSESGLLTEEVFEPENADLGYRKKYIHDKFGNIIKSIVSTLDDSSERVTLTEYDSKGRNIVSSTNSLGFHETSKYDDAKGLLTSSTDVNGIVTNYTYDSFGNIIEVATPISKTLKTTGWSAGMEDAPANALYFEWSKSTGVPSTIEFYDCLGRLLRTVTESFDGKKVYIDQVYNKKGNVEKNTEPYYAGEQQYWSKNEYDAIGRTVKQTAPDGSCNIFEYNGLETVVSDPLGSKTTKVCNINGQLISSTDNAGANVTFKYDVDGNCIETNSPRTTIRCSYDVAGNRTSLDDPDLGFSQDTYNAFGELVSHKDSHGETKYIYDNGGRIIKEIRPDVTITSSYDKERKGALDEVVSDGSIYSSYVYKYDNYGRIIKKHTVIDDKTYDSEYTYNSYNKVETMKYPSGLKIKNEYDACGIQTAVVDANSKKVYWQLQNINARGLIEKEKFGNGLVTTTTHDAKRGFIIGIHTSDIQDWTYNFDAVGNLIARNDLRRNLKETFAYDNMYRLTNVYQNGEETQSMTYDNAGNITSKSGVGRYSYENGTNRLSCISGSNYSGAKRLVSWDEIVYNSFNKITKIVSGDKSMSIEYGANKSRILSEIQGTRRYYVDKSFEQEIKEGKTINTNYIFAYGKAVAIVTQGENGECNINYVHHDHLGSIQALSDENGKLFQEMSYDAWGRRRNPDTWDAYDIQTPSNDHGFGGHEHIDVFDMINMDGRIYDPVVGRFISADPFVQCPDFTQSYNRYAYCINNPLSLIDPSGYSWLSNNWKTITASVVGIAVSVVTAGTASGVGIAIVAGAAGGAAGALTGALLNGANISQVAKTTFVGALWGAASGFLNYASGSGSLLERFVKHSFSEGWLEGAQGGNMFHGFMMGGVSTLGNYGVDKIPDAPKTVKIAASAVVGGTVDEIGGGKFANGAVTSAFNMMFNDMMHQNEMSDLELQRAVLKYKIAHDENFKRKYIESIEADGILSFAEAMLWYQVGDGTQINVDASKLKLKRLNVSDYKFGESEVYQCFTVTDALNGDNEALVYGKINVIRQKDNSFKIGTDKYDFNIETEDLWTMRNFGTVCADMLHGAGTPFYINFKGVWRKK